MQCFRSILITLVLANHVRAQEGAPSPPPAAQVGAPSEHTADGWPDLSRLLEKRGGFVPVVMPITEPAVGYGFAAFPVFLRPRAEAGAQGYARPNISTAGGLFTSNRSWGILAADSSIWKGGRIETLFAGVYGSINLKYYDDASNAKGAPGLGFNLRLSGGVARGRYRIRDSKFYLGLKYMLLSVQSGLRSESSSVEAPAELGRTDRLGSPSLFLTYDSRDNILTPTKGLFAESSYSLFDRAFGGTLNYQRLDQVAIAYFPMHPRVTVGVFTNAAFTFNEPVFYARPYVTLRGIPALRYQRQHLTESEGEIRWQFWKRFSVVGFGGGAIAWNSASISRRTARVAAGGTGVRYLLARKFGLHYGADIARGPQDKAIYFQFGSAWMRP